MLPQMMPLPWIFLFSIVFFCFFGIMMLLSCYYLNCDVSVKSIKVKSVIMPW